MPIRYVVTEPGWGDDHPIGQVLDYVDAEHMRFVRPVMLQEAPQPAAAEPAHPSEPQH